MTGLTTIVDLFEISYIRYYKYKRFSLNVIQITLFFFFFSGGLFHPADDKQEVAFRYAVERINADRSILPRFRLSAQIEKISPQDSFHASKRGNII